MIIYLFGADTWRSRQYLKQSIEKFKRERDPQGYNVVVLDAARPADAARVADELGAAPFLAEKRLVVVENPLSSGDEALLTDLTLRLKADRIPGSTALIIWQGEPIGKLKAAQNLAKLLAKEQYAQEFTPLTGVRRQRWIAAEVARRGASITTEALQALNQRTGADLWELAALLDQLAAYARGREITERDVALFSTESLDESIFALTEALFAGNRPRALELLHSQRRRGEEEGKIFGLIAWQVRTLLMIADAVAREPELTSDRAAKRLNLHPYVVKKNWSLVRKYSLAQLAARHQELLTLDYKTKTGAAPQSLLIDRLVGGF